MRLTLLLALLLSFLNAEPREALLIGNHNYEHITVLNDPLPNLKRLKERLEDVGFNVEIKTDLNSENLENAIEEFKNRLARNSNTIGFLYYTGHGCQVDYQGYLIPTNIDTTQKLKIKYNALNINKMQETLKEAGNRVNMLFLDACRDVPLGAKGSSKGLGQIQNTPNGTLVVYATEAGHIAKDNSNFINSIIDTIALPNQSIRNLPYSISDAFKSADGQKPIFSAMEIPKIVLKSGYVPPVESVQPTPPPNSSKWITPTNSVCESNGGKINDRGCKSNWENAKKICSQSGGKLPSIEELKQVVVDCGGSPVTYGDKDWNSLIDKNMANKSYQSCYKAKGFRSSFYWSSTSIVGNEGNAWFVNFDGGKEDGGYKDGSCYVRCVRAGQ